MNGKIIDIFIVEKRGGIPESKSSVAVEAGKGVVGDRYYSGTGTFSQKLAGNPKKEITFVASEEIDAFNAGQGLSLGYGELRRNVITQGIDLNGLVGKEFSVGGVRFKGIETCEPCSYLAKNVHEKVLPHLVNRAGLRAAVLSSGTLAVGDEFEICD